MHNYFLFNMREKFYNIVRLVHIGACYKVARCYKAASDFAKSAYVGKKLIFRTEP